MLFLCLSEQLPNQTNIQLCLSDVTRQHLTHINKHTACVYLCCRKQRVYQDHHFLFERVEDRPVDPVLLLEPVQCRAARQTDNAHY